MAGSALILLREGLEGALIVAIVMGYLRQVGRRDQFRAVWLGTGAAVLTSLVTGTILFATVGELQGDARRVTFALVMAGAAGVLTWMIFWMRRQARAIKGDLQAKVDTALAAGSAVALAAVVYLGVAREGLETALFFLAAAGQHSNVEAFVGGALGLSAAAALGYAVYRGASWLNLRQFFTVSGLLILLLAGGLLARALAELQVLGAIPTLWYPVFNASSIPLLDTSTFMGQTLRGLFGWNPVPSIEEIAVWAGYIAIVGTLYFSGVRPFARLLRLLRLLRLRAQPERTG